MSTKNMIYQQICYTLLTFNTQNPCNLMGNSYRRIILTNRFLIMAQFGTSVFYILILRMTL